MAMMPTLNMKQQAKKQLELARVTVGHSGYGSLASCLLNYFWRLSVISFDTALLEKRTTIA